MNLIVILVIVILIMLPFIIIKSTRLEKKYGEALEKNKELVSDLKLLKQENFYLKQMLNMDTEQ